MIQSTFPTEFTLDIQQEVEIKSTPERAFEALLANLTSNMETPDGVDMCMRLELMPGGRWYRDLDGDDGHLWGHVQVFKRNSLLEITGPMFMSYPVVSHIQFRLTPIEAGTLLSFRHQALGLIDDQHRAGVTEGWGHMIEGVKNDAEH